MDYKKIYDALETIKKCCAENENCPKCPLSVLGKDKMYKCKIGDASYCDTPRYWKLEKPKYKAFAPEGEI